ncbi:MAG: right-handed parallel beta-helix repeat-containing protein [Marinovum sp.]|nr:right-handed parallel beta-helix repeat-containing protein [Marinovum sp.]
MARPRTWRKLWAAARTSACAMACAVPALAAPTGTSNVEDMRDMLRALEAKIAPLGATGMDGSSIFGALFDIETAQLIVSGPAETLQAAPSGTLPTSLFASGTDSIFGGDVPRPKTKEASVYNALNFWSKAHDATVTPGSSDTPSRAQDVDISDFRAVFAALIQGHTGQNSQAVINAQGPRGTQALSLRSGVFTLADVASYAEAEGYTPLPNGALTIPIVVWPDAELLLRPDDRLTMSRRHGTFLISMGRLTVNGAIIEGSGPENAQAPSFEPFVTVMQGGTLTLRDSTLRGLGFGQTPKFIGLSVLGTLLNPRSETVSLHDNLFEDMASVSLDTVSAPSLSGNTFRAMRDVGLHLSNATQAHVIDNIFAGGAKANSIRIERHSSHAVLERNTFLQGDRVAILVASGSDNAVLRQNVIWKRDGAGIKFHRSRCGLAENNVVLDNRQKGIEVRSSDATMLRQNTISGNQTAGIWISGQRDGAVTVIDNNQLTHNRAGISAATGAELLVRGNDLSDQFPRLLDGDIAPLTHHVAMDLHGTEALHISKGQRVPGWPEPTCGHGS